MAVVTSAATFERKIYEREIKFRPWDGAKFGYVSIGNDRITWPAPEYFEQKVAGKGEGTPEQVRFFDVVCFQQFTGLRNKNGKEIYEGDIIKTREMNRVTDPVDYGMTGLKLSLPQQVRFEHSCFYPLACWMRPEEMEWEVIGNIYENPELLDAQNAANNSAHS